jgi:mono/diheme cytochrome c family protein
LPISSRLARPVAARVATLGALLLALLLALPIACRDPRETPTGKNLYLQHCAACHGESGDGSGPLAASLVRPPSDLRKIAARNGGRFDESDVMAYIDGRKNVAEHGTREMPVWGAVFQEENAPEHYPAYTSLLHSRALTDYLRSIQE